MQRNLGTLNFCAASTSGREPVQRAPQLHSCWAGGRQPLLRATTCRPARRRGAVVLAAAHPSSLTLQQRWLSVKHDMYEKIDEVKARIRALPPVAALLSLLQRIQHFLQPYVERYQAARGVAREWRALRVERYREFVGEETKRKWEWQCRHEKEHCFWLAVVNAIWGILATVLWETITPVSFALAVLPPLWVAWALHDNVLRSPIFYGMLLMMPLKFVPGGPFRWI